MEWGGLKRLRYKRGHRTIKTSYLLALLPIMVFFSAYFLRHNNLKMVELRNNVIAADKKGKGVKEAIEALNTHIFKHMNTTTVRPVELVNTYNREAQAIITAASKSSSNNVYQKAAAACEQRGVPLTSVAECAAQYALSHSKDVSPQKVVLPDKDLFIYSFVSPRWTPDLAGWSVLITAVILLWFLVRLIEYIAIRFIVRKHLKHQF